MAKTYTAEDVKFIINYEFDQESQTLIYKLSLNNDKDESKNVKSNDIDEQFLNGAEWNKLMKNIVGLPEHLASHKKLLKFMKSAFSNDKNVYFFVNHHIDNVDETRLSYTKFYMKPEYITGIPLKLILADIFKVYSSDSLAIDASLIASPDQVKTYIFVI